MKKASEITISALRRCSPKLANAASISCSVLAFMIRRQAEGLGCGLHVLRFVRSFRIGRVDEIADRADVRHELAQQAQPFRSQHVADKGYARDIAVGSIEGGDETQLDRVSANREDDRNDRGLPCFGLWTIAQTALGVILGSYLCVAGSTPPEETIVWQLVYISVGPFIVAVLVVVVVSGWEAL